MKKRVTVADDPFCFCLARLAAEAGVDDADGRDFLDDLHVEPFGWMCLNELTAGRLATDLTAFQNQDYWTRAREYPTEFRRYL